VNVPEIDFASAARVLNSQRESDKLSSSAH